MAGNNIYELNGKLVVDKTGAPIECDKCPCGGEGCSPQTLGTESGKCDEHGTCDTWDLSVYKNSGPKGITSARWRLIETSHSTGYGSGVVSPDGRLVGLPAQFKFNQEYEGHMALQIGCVQEGGSIKWP